MKSNKLASSAIAVVLALCASNAKAPPIGPELEQFTKLNFSLIAEQQVILIPGVLESTIKTSKITNKDLLSYMATALNTNWPAGAQLAVVGIGDIFVVDKTGTNPIFNLTMGIYDVRDTNVVYFSVDYDATLFYLDKSVSLEKSNELTPSRTVTRFGKIFFHLFNEQNGVTNTDLYFDGLNTTKSRSTTMVITTNKTILQTINEEAPVTGDGTFNDEWTVVKGKVTGSGKQELVPLILTNPPPPIIIITNIFPFTNIFIITNRPPPGFHPTTNQPPPIILNP
jgi:hypothetical protein